MLATHHIAPEPSITRREIRALFLHAYPQFAPALRVVEEPALAIVAVRRDGQVAGLRKLPARIGEPAAAILGRHECCDVALPGVPALPLRQLAVVIDSGCLAGGRPVTSFARGAAVPYRVLDLRSQSGVVDEDGRALRGFATDGPAMIGCPGHAIFFLPLGDPSDWPAAAEDAWAMLPERVYGGELSRGSAFAIRPAMAGMFVAAMPTSCSMIVRTGELRSAANELVEGDTVGRLELVGPLASVTIEVGAAALRDGILFGRYDRCDLAAKLGDPTLSRVHAMLIAIAGRLLVVDTASRHGLGRVGGERESVIAIGALPASYVDFQLGKYTRVRWRSAMC